MGSITVYTGPMFSGKTNLLLGAYERATIAHKKVLAFKPKIDDRFGKNVIKSRRFGEIDATNITYIDDLKKYDVDVYIIDEFQFLQGDIKTIVEMADEKGKTFFISRIRYDCRKEAIWLNARAFSNC